MVPNPARPVPVNPQFFLLPVLVQVASDGGGVTPAQIQGDAGAPLDRLLAEDLADQLDRNPFAPAPFAYHGASVLWRHMAELRSDDPDSALVAARLTGAEVGALRRVLRGATPDPLVAALVSKFDLDK